MDNVREREREIKKRASEIEISIVALRVGQLTGLTDWTDRPTDRPTNKINLI